jgi:hypothetical protein
MARDYRCAETTIRLAQEACAARTIACNGSNMHDKNQLILDYLLVLGIKIAI